MALKEQPIPATGNPGHHLCSAGCLSETFVGVSPRVSFLLSFVPTVLLFAGFPSERFCSFLRGLQIPKKGAVERSDNHRRRQAQHGCLERRVAVATDARLTGFLI